MNTSANIAIGTIIVILIIGLESLIETLNFSLLPIRSQLVSWKPHYRTIYQSVFALLYLSLLVSVTLWPQKLYSLIDYNWPNTLKLIVILIVPQILNLGLALVLNLFTRRK